MSNDEESTPNDYMIILQTILKLIYHSIVMLTSFLEKISNTHKSNSCSEDDYLLFERLVKV